MPCSYGPKAISRFIETQLGPSDMIGTMYPLTPLDAVRFTRNHDAVMRGVQQFLGRKFEILGLDRTERLLRQLPRGPRLDRIRGFVGDARLALAQTGNALHATANPIELVRAPDRGRTWALSADVQAYALGLTICSRR